jgi:hypothetical protein
MVTTASLQAGKRREGWWSGRPVFREEDGSSIMDHGWRRQGN